MISFTSLGNYGRLGNQMFQYAAMLGISEKTGFDFGFSPGRLIDCFKISLGKVLTSEIQQKYFYREMSFEFSDVVFSCPDETEFIGYFQSEKYWSHCQKKVLDQFKFIQESNAEYGDFTSLHIRRGDYVNLKDTHTCLSETDYYDRAISSLGPRKIIVFTDDREWMERSGLLDKWKRDVIIEFCSERTDIQELHLMSKAKNAIIANSSFSWWGAYLGPHQRGGKVIAPSQWFGASGPKRWEDVYCKNWEKV